MSRPQYMSDVNSRTHAQYFVFRTTNGACIIFFTCFSFFLLDSVDCLLFILLASYSTRTAFEALAFQDICCPPATQNMSTATYKEREMIPPNNTGAQKALVAFFVRSTSLLFIDFRPP